MQPFLQDMRYGARILLKTPAFTLIAVLTLSLGIGANTAIFSFVNAFLLKSVPGVEDPDRLFQLGETGSRGGFSTFSIPNYLDYRDQNTTLSGLASRRFCAFHLNIGGEAERVEGALVTGNYFETLGVRAAAGRLIEPGDALREGESQSEAIPNTAHKAGRANLFSLNDHRG